MSNENFIEMLRKQIADARAELASNPSASRKRALKDKLKAAVIAWQKVTKSDA